MIDYTLHEQIGQGEYGRVYRATHKLSQEIVAVKSVDIHKFNETPKLLELSMQEIEVLQKLKNCMNVVRFIELIKTPSQYHFVYEYCSGGPLDKLLLLQGHFSEQKSLKILYQLIEAFKALREHSIIHRDLKPSNILIHNGIYKLADFGFCKPIKNDLTATMLGSPIYMAPEVLRGLQYNSKADIWSLGAMFYELLIGQCPFEEKSIAKLITAQDETDWTIPPQFHFSQQTQNLLKSMLIKDPNNRCTWDYLFQMPLNSEGEFTGELEVYNKQKQLQSQTKKLSHILQDIVNERCKIQFICQTAHLILEQAVNEKAGIAAYQLLNLANNRGLYLMNIVRNYQIIDQLNTQYPTINHLQQILKKANEDKYFINNFEYQRLIETIQKEMDQLSQGVSEMKSILQDVDINRIDLVKDFVKQIKQANYLNFIDTNKDKNLLLHCVQILDALNVDKFMSQNIDPTLDNYLEIKSMTKKQLIDRFEQYIL